MSNPPWGLSHRCLCQIRTNALFIGQNLEFEGNIINKENDCMDIFEKGRVIEKHIQERKKERIIN